MLYLHYMDCNRNGSGMDQEWEEWTRNGQGMDKDSQEWAGMKGMNQDSLGIHQEWWGSVKCCVFPWETQVSTSTEQQTSINL